MSDIETDLDGAGVANRGFDAWADCRNRIDCIRAIYTGGAALCDMDRLKR